MTEEKKNNKGFWLALAAVALIAAAGAALLFGKETPEGSSSALPESSGMETRLTEEGGTVPAASSGTAAASLLQTETFWPADTHEAGAKSANAGRNATPEDPQLPGYYFDLAATDELYGLFAAENTNNTDPVSPYRSIGAESKIACDALSTRFAAGELSAEDLKEAVKAVQTVWPDESGILTHHLRQVSAAAYRFAGTDMGIVKERILLGNLSGRHYLFLQVYVNKEENAVHVYMVNGMLD